MQGVKVNQVEFNIGMEKNPYLEDDVRAILQKEGFSIFKTTKSYIKVGEYLGENIPTFVTNVSTTKSEEDIIKAVETICLNTAQVCIGIKINAKAGHLVYHPYYTQSKMEFNNEYFITIN